MKDSAALFLGLFAILGMIVISVTILAYLLVTFLPEWALYGFLGILALSVMAWLLIVYSEGK